MNEDQLADVWRHESPHVLGALLRWHVDYGDCEDAAQEALLAAAQHWPLRGIPDNPRGWLIKTASRKLIDQARSQQARQRREDADWTANQALEHPQPGPSEEPTDDSLQLLIMCCHPSLSRPSQVALTLKAVGGLSTEAIAAAYLVPTATMGQRLSRARATLRSADVVFALPTDDELPQRLAAVLDVCHLIFNEGYTRTEGTELFDTGLADEAIRLARMLHTALPDHREVGGALALFLLTHARTPARTTSDGDLVPLKDQDRSLWEQTKIAEAVALLETTLPEGVLGRFQISAAIAAVHAEAPSWEDTDWPQIKLLYAMLHDVAPSPAVTLNRAVAVAMADGPERGMTMLKPLLEDSRMQRHHRTHAVHAHLLEMTGKAHAARDAYLRAAGMTASTPEQRYLNASASRLK